VVAPVLPRVMKTVPVADLKIYSKRYSHLEPLKLPCTDTIGEYGNLATAPTLSEADQSFISRDRQELEHPDGDISPSLVTLASLFFAFFTIIKAPMPRVPYITFHLLEEPSPALCIRFNSYRIRAFGLSALLIRRPVESNMGFASVEKGNYQAVLARHQRFQLKTVIEGAPVKENNELRLAYRNL